MRFHESLKLELANDPILDCRRVKAKVPARPAELRGGSQREIHGRCQGKRLQTKLRRALKRPFKERERCRSQALPHRADVDSWLKTYAATNDACALNRSCTEVSNKARSEVFRRILGCF